MVSLLNQIITEHHMHAQYNHEAFWVYLYALWYSCDRADMKPTVYEISVKYCRPKAGLGKLQIVAW